MRTFGIGMRVIGTLVHGLWSDWTAYRRPCTVYEYQDVLVRCKGRQDQHLVSPDKPAEDILSHAVLEYGTYHLQSSRPEVTVWTRTVWATVDC